MSKENEVINAEYEENADTRQAGVQVSDIPAKRKPGRKPSVDKADRVQVSIYLNREIYEGIKDYAAFRDENISDISARLVTDFVSQHLDKINEARNFLKELNFR